MIRMTLQGRSPRVLRHDELATSLWALYQGLHDAPAGRLDLEWLSPAGLVLERRVYASLAELSLLLPALLTEHVPA
jgi:hypothetical protein